MVITVIGHFCLDVIRHADKTETAGFGGIYFSLATLANLLSHEDDTIRPVFGVGKGEHDAVIDRLSGYSNIDCTGIYRFSGPTNQVSLTYSSKDRRIERSEFISDPIPWKRVRNVITGSDMVLINMISGLDITLDTLDEIRMSVREAQVPVYLDVHSLTLGIKDDFTRFHRPVDAWRRWLFMLHGAHLNEEEAAILSPDHLGEEALANHVLSLNTGVLHITRGERGCTAYVEEQNRMEKIDFPGIDADLGIDSTGCGDVFVAAYCGHYLKTGQVLPSVDFANRVAGRKARRTGSAEIDELSMFRLDGKLQREGRA